MTRIAGCTTKLREVASFEEFADHLRDVLDQAAGADLVVLPELVTFELMSVIPGWRDATDLQPVIDTAQFADRYRDFVASEALARGQYILGGTHLVRKAEVKSRLVV